MKPDELPNAFERVKRWAQTQRGLSILQPSSAYRWTIEIDDPVLAGSKVELQLPKSFPWVPAKIVLDKKLCLHLPHIEESGNFCHGAVPDAEDAQNPIGAVLRVLGRFADFLKNCQSPSWISAEFHRERGDYWRRHVTAVAGVHKVPSELLLDTIFPIEEVLSLPTLDLSESRTLVTSKGSTPEDLAKRHGWSVGTIVRGRTLLIPLPQERTWTPQTWPRTFSELTALVRMLTGGEYALDGWFKGLGLGNKAPVLVVFVQAATSFGFRIFKQNYGRLEQPRVLPVKVTRIDAAWNLARDHQLEAVSKLQSKRVVVLGAGSLGSLVIEYLARAGIGEIGIVEKQSFESENIARHRLGASNIGAAKADAIKTEISKQIPGVQINVEAVHDAVAWLRTEGRTTRPDLIIDCTGEPTVRVALGIYRQEVGEPAPALIAWMEAFCAGIHVVQLTGPDTWPLHDPAGTVVNCGKWPEDTKISLPGCNQGFNPYGMAGAARAAGLVAERAFSMLEGASTSCVWSTLRNKSFFLTSGPGVTFNYEPPDDSVESVTIRRNIEILNAKK